ncbi:MAG: MCP four helix bundle domain-containing protein [Anaerolineaceae bacterium]
MKALNNLKTGVKLIGGFVFIALILVVVAVLGFSNMKTINDHLTELYFDRLVPVNDLGDIGEDIYAIRGDVYKLLLIPSEEEASIKKISDLMTTVDATVEKYRATYLLESEIAELAIFEPAWAEYKDSVNEILAWNAAGDDAAAIASLTGTGRGSTARKAVGNSAKALKDINVKAGEELNTSADAAFAAATSTILIVSIGAFLLAIGLGLVISNSLSKPLGALVKIATAVSVGDLVRDLDQKVKDGLTMRKDEVGDIAKSFEQVINYMQGMGDAANTISQNDLTVSVTPNSEKDELAVAFVNMINGLRTAVTEINDSASNLSAASEQLASAANQAGQATNQISMTVQQVAKGTAD